MAKVTIKDLKQELMDTIKDIDKEKVTIYDLKVLAEAVETLASVKEIDYMDAIMNITSSGFGTKPTTVSDLKGAE